MDHFEQWIQQQEQGKRSIRSWLFQHRIGLLGTALVHLIAINVFLIYRLGEDPVKRQETQLLIALDKEEQFDVKKEIQKEQTEREQMIEQMIANELRKDLKNIPVNTASKTAEKTKNEISTENYLKELKNDYDFEKHDFSTDPGEVAIAKREEKKIEENAQYKGLTTIFYELKDRQHGYLHVPVYMCETYGKVCVDIYVDNSGNVVQTAINAANTLVTDECLLEAAMASARRSRFNASASAPPRQKGMITYLFLAQ